jgi:hypothetical protein
MGKVEQTSHVDRDRPCLVCGAPWRVTVTIRKTFDGGQLTPDIDARESGECSARCFARGGDSADRYNATRAERERLGYP